MDGSFLSPPVVIVIRPCIKPGFLSVEVGLGERLRIDLARTSFGLPGMSGFTMNWRRLMPGGPSSLSMYLR